MSRGLTDEQLDRIYSNHLGTLADEVPVGWPPRATGVVVSVRGRGIAPRTAVSVALLVGLLAAMTLTLATIGQAPTAPSSAFETGSLAFARGGDLYVAHPDGSGVTRFAAGMPDSSSIERFAFAPDRTGLAFVRSARDARDDEVVIANVEGEMLGSPDVRSRRGGASVSWAPDSQRLAVFPGEAGLEVTLVDRNGATVDRLELPRVSVTGFAWFEYALMSWSPDGAWMAMPVHAWSGSPACRSSGKEETCYVLIASDGTGVVGLTDDASGYLAWAPDGRVAVTHWDEGTVQIWLADRSTSQTVSLPDGLQPVDGHALAWSSDGMRLVVAARERGGTESSLYLIDGNGVLSPIETDAFETISSVAWRPGDDRILFSGSRAPGSDASIWSVDAAGGEAMALVETDGSIFDVAGSPYK